ncbi:MAG: hypothetical protein V4574_12290 [Pseudomonadota bacterium]
MARKDGGKKPPKSPKIDTAKIRTTPEEIFAFWTEENMREAKPIPIDLSRPEDESEK